MWKIADAWNEALYATEGCQGLSYKTCGALGEFQLCAATIYHGSHDDHSGGFGFVMSDLVERLERLNLMREQGHLSDDEFKTAKGQVLSGASTHSGTPLAASTEDKVRLSDSDGTTAKNRPLWLNAVAGVLIVSLGAGSTYWWIASGGWHTPEASAKVGVKNLNCRASASDTSDVQEVIPEGATLSMAEKKDGWAKVAGKDCWVKDEKLVWSKKAASVEEDEADQAKADLALMPARYDLTTNPNADAVSLATKLLNSGYECVMGPTREIGQTYAILDTEAGDMKYIAQARTGDLLDPHESVAKINGTTIELKGEDEGWLNNNTMRITSLEKADNGDILMFATITEGRWMGTPLWWMRCGTKSMGSESWWKNFTDTNHVIDVAYD